MSQNEGILDCKLQKFKMSAKSKYAIALTIEILATKEQEKQVSFSVFSLADNAKVHEFSLKSMRDSKYEIVEVLVHPIVEELVLLYDKGGWVKLVDIVMGKCIWQMREMSFFRDIGNVRASIIDQCAFSKDGTKVVVMTAKGCISLYAAPNSVPGAQLAPIDQYQ